MDFIRRHLFLIVCGVVSIVGIALGVTGLRNTPQVLAGMESAKTVYENLDSLRSRGVSPAMIDTKKAAIRKIVDQRDNLFEKAKEYCRYKPLAADVFPDGTKDARLGFQQRYTEAMWILFDALKPVAPPNDFEIAQMRDVIADEKHDSSTKRRMFGSGAVDAPDDQPHHTPAGVLTLSGAMKDAFARAAMNKAQGGYCYAIRPGKTGERAQEPSLEFHSGMKGTDEVFELYLEDCWDAQVGYWLQKDVVDAIVAVNERAATRILDNDGAPWVGVLPVKEVVSIRTSDGYIESGGEILAGGDPGGDKPALPPGTDSSVFTGTASTDTYDAKQFSVKLVMDQRYITELADEICRGTFHALVRVSYKAASVNRRMHGKIYGAGPVVRVVMDFETIMLESPYRCWMPEAVRELYGLTCPEPAAPDDSGDE